MARYFSLGGRPWEVDQTRAQTSAESRMFQPLGSEICVLLSTNNPRSPHTLLRLRRIFSHHQG